MKRIVTLLVFFTFSITAFAQTKREWLEYGDAAFNTGNYNTAVSYYLKIIDKNTPADITHPYETKPYTPPVKKNGAAGFKFLGLTVAYIPKETNTKDSTLPAIAANKDSAKTTGFSGTDEQYAVHQIAESYRLNRDYKNAEIWYQKSVKMNGALYPFEGYWYGDALMKNKKYPSANLQFDAIVSGTDLNSKKSSDSILVKLAKLKIAGCYLALDESSTVKGVTITEADSVFNSGASSFAVNYYGDENSLEFTAARDGNTIIDPKKEKGRNSCDIYTAAKTDKGWADLKKVDGPINTNMNEGAGFLSRDRHSFYFTRWSAADKNQCAIYFSRFMNENWLIPQKMNDKVNADGYKSTDPSVIPDGTIIYFSSNRPGGYGKMDIWYEFIDEDGRTYGEPVNMGPIINTAADEVSPFYHPATATLYFSSDGHPGFGGLDVFKSSYNSNDSIWSAPKNLGQPINSNNDDSYFILNQNQLQGFVTSDRKDCKDCKGGGSCNKIYTVVKEPNVYDIRGTVYSSEDNQVLANATITFKDIRGEREPFFLTTDSKGTYFYKLGDGMELYMKAQKNNYFGDAGTVVTLGLTESKHFERDFFLAPSSSTDVTAFPSVEYDSEMANLSPEAKKALDNLADFLKLNNNFSVEIDSYADASEHGVDKTVIQLSEDRSKSCVDYLSSKGIALERMIAKGYGSTKLLIAKPQTDAERQKNRRTTFSPVKEGSIKPLK